MLYSQTRRCLSGADPASISPRIFFFFFFFFFLSFFMSPYVLTMYLPDTPVDRTGRVYCYVRSIYCATPRPKRG